VAAFLAGARGLQVALGFAAPMAQPVGRRILFGRLALGSLARPAKIDDVAHVSASRSGTILHPCHVNSVANAPIPWRRRSDCVAAGWGDGGIRHVGRSFSLARRTPVPPKAVAALVLLAIRMKKR